MDGSDTARGRLTIWHDLVWYEHGLLRVGCHPCSPGKFGQKVPDAVTASGVEAFYAADCMSAMWVRYVRIACPPGGFCHISGLCPGQGSFDRGQVEKLDPAQRSPICPANNGAIRRDCGSSLVLLGSPPASERGSESIWKPLKTSQNL